MSINQLGNICVNNFSVVTATAGVTRFLDVDHTDATGNPNSNALIFARTLPGAGDSFAQFIISGATNWSVGADNSDNDDFKISRSLALGTTDCIQIHNQGAVSEPLQPCFSAYLSVATAGVTGTGMGSIYNFICDSVFCNGGGHYDVVNGWFTAPVAGKYSFTVYCELINLTPAFADIHVGFSLVPGTIYQDAFEVGNGAQTAIMTGFSNILQLNAGETVRPYVYSSGEAGNVNSIDFIPGFYHTVFSGFLIA